MKSDYALVFPGQGSQYAGMGKDVFDAFEEARLTFDEAAAAIDRDMTKLCFQGSPEELNATVNTQTAVFTVDMVLYRIFTGRCSLGPAFMAGHSLGEYVALTAAEAISLEDMLPLVLARATFMQEAVPVGRGAMAAVMGLDAERLEEICREVSAAGNIVSPANLNGPGQMVISGAVAAVEAAMQSAKAAGGKALKLPISVPCHCSLLDSAGRRLDEKLADVTFENCTVPVIPNSDPQAVHSRETTRALLVQQLTAPVRWQETIEKMVSLGVGTFIEIGPKKTLSGLIRRIAPEARLFNVEDRSSLENTLGNL